MPLLSSSVRGIPGTSVVPFAPRLVRGSRPGAIADAILKLPEASIRNAINRWRITVSRHAFAI